MGVRVATPAPPGAVKPPPPPAPPPPRRYDSVPVRSPSPWLTTVEAAAYVRLHPKALLRKRRRGELAGVRCGSNGKAILFHRGDLDAWLQGEGRPE